MAEISEIQKMLSPGVSIDVAYSSNTNTFKAKEDVLANTRYQEPFNSLQLGSAGIGFQIANKSLVGQAIIYMELPELADNIYLNRGWGYSVIDRLEWSIGGSMVLSQNGDSVFATAMTQCETSEKRDALLRNAGDEVTGPNQGINRAVIHVPLPYSTIRYLGRKLPYDSSLVNQPLRVILYLKNREEIFSGSGYASAPSALTRGYFQLRQFNFKDQAQSLRNDMLADRELFYSYPFFYGQSYTSPPFVGSVDKSAPAVVNLVGFRSGNLQSIHLQLKEIHTGSETIKNNNQYEQITNIELTWNGQVIIRADDNTEAVWCLESGLTDCSVPNSVAPVSNEDAPYTTQPVKSFVHALVLSQFNPVSQDTLIQSGYNVGSQVLTVSFTTPKDAQAYVLNCTYNYLATVLTKDANAEVTF